MESYSVQYNKYIAFLAENNLEQYLPVSSGLVYDYDRDVYTCNLPASITLQVQLTNQLGIKKMLTENAEKVNKELQSAQSGGSSKAIILSALSNFVVGQVDPNLLKITAEDKAEIRSYILKVAELFNVSSERTKR